LSIPAQKQALVFVHGFLGGSAQWQAQVDTFASRYQFVAPDLHGFGECHDLTARNRIGDYADDVLSMLTDIGIDRFHLVGHSMGGMIVQEMVARMPDRIDRLVLYGTGPVGLLPGRFETIAKSKRRAIEDGAVATARRIAATWFLEREAATGFEACAAIAERAALASIHAGLDAMEHWSGEEALEKIKAPTLVLWGDGDRTYPWSQPQSLWQQIPGANLAVVPGCAHAVHLEKPKLFNELLADFLS
jgi:pimeloyl-ACP methyl ester carboxylesterase